MNGFNGVTTVSARMLDPLMGALALSTSRLVPSSATTLTVSAWSPAQPGTYRIEVAMTSGSITRKQVLEVVVARSGKARAVR